jgi:transposase
MLYLAIDQHRKQLTVNLRNEEGQVVLRRQVSTQWQRVRGFFQELSAQASLQGGWIAILEVCGFNDWLLTMLREYACREIVLVQPERASRRKTDRRDANTLGELLWVNRHRLLAGQRVQQLRRVHPASPQDALARQLTSLRRRLASQRTRTINQVQRILLRHNLQQECPTKTLQTQKARGWLEQLPLSEVDRLELNGLLAQWKLWEEQLQAVQERIQVCQAQHPTALIVATLPGASAYSSLAIGARVGDIARFPRPESLANYWGLAPSCRNSGEATQRLGSITKEGSALVRFLLGQMVLHALRRDPWMRTWYQRIKRRRGTKIARVAVMRRLVSCLWHMLRQQEAYQPGGMPRARLLGQRVGTLPRGRDQSPQVPPPDPHPLPSLCVPGRT